MRKRLFANPKARFRIKLVSLICALLITALSVIPFWNRESDATLLSLVFGALAAGALLRDLIADMQGNTKE